MRGDRAIIQKEFSGKDIHSPAMCLAAAMEIMEKTDHGGCFLMCSYIAACTQH